MIWNCFYLSCAYDWLKKQIHIRMKKRSRAFLKTVEPWQWAGSSLHLSFASEPINSSDPRASLFIFSTMINFITWLTAVIEERNRNGKGGKNFQVMTGQKAGNTGYKYGGCSRAYMWEKVWVSEQKLTELLAIKRKMEAHLLYHTSLPPERIMSEGEGCSRSFLGQLLRIGWKGKRSLAFCKTNIHKFWMYLSKC